MVGINVPIPVPVAYYSFGGWKASLFGDSHIYGPEASTSTRAARSSRAAGPTRRSSKVDLGFPQTTITPGAGETSRVCPEAPPGSSAQSAAGSSTRRMRHAAPRAGTYRGAALVRRRRDADVDVRLAALVGGGYGPRGESGPALSVSPLRCRPACSAVSVGLPQLHAGAATPACSPQRRDGPREDMPAADPGADRRRPPLDGARLVRQRRPAAVRRGIRAAGAARRPRSGRRRARYRAGSYARSQQAGGPSRAVTAVAGGNLRGSPRPPPLVRFAYRPLSRPVCESAG